MLPSSLSICLCTHQRRDWALEMLQSLKNVRPPKQSVQVDLLVVCNACTDGSADAIRGQLADGFPWPWQVLEVAEPGLNTARNTAIRSSRGEVITFLDDDILMNQGWLQALLACFEAVPFDLVEGRIELLWEQGNRPAWMVPKVESMLNRSQRGCKRTELFDGFINGCNLSFRRDVVRKIGLFRLGIDRSGKDLTAMGDVEFGVRAIKAGFKHFFEPDALVMHRTPNSRLSPDYLDGLAYQWGRGQVLIRGRLGTPGVLRSIGGRLALWLLNEPRRWWARRRGDEAALRTSSFWGQMGKGGLAAWVEIFRGRSPMRPPEAYLVEGDL